MDASDILRAQQNRWQEAASGDIYEKLVPVARAIATEQRARIADGWRHARLHAGMRPDVLTAFGALGFVSAERSGPGKSGARFSFNVIESCIETAAARIAGDEIRPTAQTDGADWDIQERAELLTQLTDGIAYETDFRETAVDCAEDAMVFGTGVEKTFNERGRVITERVFPLEILVDDEDGMYGKPRQLIQHRAMPRDVLQTRFPKRAKLIAAAPRAENKERRKSVADTVMVFEGWYLPSGADEKDGHWAICLENGDLDDAVWEKDRFPFRFLRWKKPTMGFWGTGIAEQLTGIQIEINRVVRFAQESLSYGAFKIFMEVGSKVIKEHLNKTMGGMIEYRGTPPQFVVPNVLNEQIMRWMLELYKKAYELVGISPMAAQSIKPAGLDSKPALRAYDDIQDSRFTRFGKRWETWHKHIALDWIDEARDLHEKNKEEGGFSIVAPNQDGISRINWKDINLKTEEFVLQIFPESSLPRTPQARFQTIQEWMQGGLLEKPEGRRLMRLPDLKSATDLDDAPRNVVLWQIAQMLKGKATQPDPLQDLVLARQLVTNAYNLGRIKNVPEKRLELFRVFLSQVDAVQQLALPPPAPGPGPSGPAPLGAPAPPPTSPLLPNAPAPAA